MSKIYDINQKINSIFGVLTITANDKFPAAVDDSYTKGFGIRESGMAKEILKLDNLQTALNAPGTYLDRMKAGMKSIGESSGVVYKDSYKQAFDRGLNEKECEKIAGDAMDRYEKTQKQAFDLEFPPEIVGQVMKKLKK